jgi:hypothetical protein
MEDGTVYFIQADAEGHHLYRQTITGHHANGHAITTDPITMGTFPREAAARHHADATLAAA